MNDGDQHTEEMGKGKIRPLSPEEKSEFPSSILPRVTAGVSGSNFTPRVTAGVSGSNFTSKHTWGE